MSGNFAIKGGGGGRTPNGKCHLKFPFWFSAHLPKKLSATTLCKKNVLQIDNLQKCTIRIEGGTTRWWPGGHLVITFSFSFLGPMASTPIIKLPDYTKTILLTTSWAFWMSIMSFRQTLSLKMNKVWSPHCGLYFFIYFKILLIRCK